MSVSRDESFPNRERERERDESGESLRDLQMIGKITVSEKLDFPKKIESSEN